MPAGNCSALTLCFLLPIVPKERPLGLLSHPIPAPSPPPLGSSASHWLLGSGQLRALQLLEKARPEGSSSERWLGSAAPARISLQSPPPPLSTTAQLRVENADPGQTTLRHTCWVVCVFLETSSALSPHSLWSPAEGTVSEGKTRTSSRATSIYIPREPRLYHREGDR